MKIIILIGIALSFFLSSTIGIIFGGADIPKRIDIWKKIGNFKIGDDKNDENN